VICVFDACALIAYIKGEPGEEIIRELLEGAEDKQNTLYINILNLLEVCYGFCKDVGEETTAAIMQKLYNLPITVVDRITTFVFDEAARLKSNYKLSLADAIGIATAKDLSGQFVTSDHSELEPVEQHEQMSFLWLPAKPKK
jgi:predicted nucleic acid-binding protein